MCQLILCPDGTLKSNITLENISLTVSYSSPSLIVLIAAESEAFVFKIAVCAALQ